MRTDVDAFAEAMEKYKGKVLCVVTTTSCFAPRAIDSVAEVASLAKAQDVFHVVNNAYGLQCSRIASDLTEACKRGRVDVLISSTDKNFMVPVGGSIVYSPKGAPAIVDKVKTMYPGRASGAPITDLFITQLSMGESHFKQLLKERKANFLDLKDGLKKFAEETGEAVLETPNNKISIAVSFRQLDEKCLKPNNVTATFFGSYLFSRRVSGVRVVA